MKLFIGVKAFITQKGMVLILREAAYDAGANERKRLVSSTESLIRRALSV